MSQPIRSLRGTKDLLPEETARWRYVERVAAEVAESYGFEEIRIPSIERTDLFVRSIGDSTDVVQKEMYSFKMGSEHIALRPEGTAGIARATIQNGVLNNMPNPAKFYWMGGAFRHENPQAGRQREFHQFTVECFGSPSPLQDAEIIALADTFLRRLGVAETTLHINSIGCPACRPAYYEKLRDYYRPLLPQLCEDCNNRFARNPLRLLDCKKEQCQPFKAEAPRGIDHLCTACEEHFAGVEETLKALALDFIVDPNIVRGLDYYTRTVFEFISGNIGAQSTICGGGRYDGLIEELGGPATPALGFGIGLERLLMVLEASGSDFPKERPCDIYIGSLGEAEGRMALALANALRQDGFFVLADTVSRSVRAQMKYADRKQARFSCIIGGNEIAEGRVDIRNMETGETTPVALTAQDFSGFMLKIASDSIRNSGFTIQNKLENLLQTDKENDEQ